MFATYYPNEITHTQAHIHTLPSRGKLKAFITWVGDAGLADSVY